MSGAADTPLTVADLHREFGGVHAVDGASFEIRPAGSPA